VRLESLAVLKQNGFSPDSTKRGSDADRADRAVFLVNSDRARLRNPKKTDGESGAHARRAARVQKKGESKADSRFESTVGPDES
jgi:hypothetical protein